MSQKIHPKSLRLNRHYGLGAQYFSLTKKNFNWAENLFLSNYLFSFFRNNLMYKNSKSSIARQRNKKVYLSATRSSVKFFRNKILLTPVLHSIMQKGRNSKQSTNYLNSLPLQLQRTKKF
jgi:hypothetical protein